MYNHHIHFSYLCSVLLGSFFPYSNVLTNIDDCCPKRIYISYKTLNLYLSVTVYSNLYWNTYLLLLKFPPLVSSSRRKHALWIFFNSLSARPAAFANERNIKLFIATITTITETFTIPCILLLYS